MWVSCCSILMSLGCTRGFQLGLGSLQGGVVSAAFISANDPAPILKKKNDLFWEILKDLDPNTQVLEYGEVIPTIYYTPVIEETADSCPKTELRWMHGEKGQDIANLQKRSGKLWPSGRLLSQFEGWLATF